MNQVLKCSWKLEKRFNIEMSPTGEVKPYSWRVKYERFAMNIRGLNITIFAPLVFLFHIKQWQFNFWPLLLIMPTGYLFGYIYELGWKINLEKMPRFIRSPTQLGEFISGATIMSSFLFFTSYLTIN